MVEIRQKIFIEDAIESVQVKQDFRPHLGASQIGKDCSRELWYSFRWAKKRSIIARQDRLFNRGHMEELIVIKDLINAGCTVKGINIDESIAKTFKLLYNIDLPEQKQFEETFANGHGGAACDGIIYGLPDAPKTPHLLEVKTSNTKKFENLRINKVQKAFPVHYIQDQVYMHVFKLKRALYISVCKENDQRHYERINYDKDTAVRYIDRATEIISSERAPGRISNDPEFFLCRWCDYSDICHQQTISPTLNCRTCNNVGLRDRGVWVCEIKKANNQISFKRQVKGCKNYQLSKGFI